MRQVLPQIEQTRQHEVIRGLDQSGALGYDYGLLVLLSCVIATFGLVLDSAAVIIGAMLIAPLMSPILRCSLALIRGDVRRFARAMGTLLVGVGLAIALSGMFGTLVSVGPFNFLEELPAEILGRTRPNLFDLVIALAGGTAAAYALAQPHLSATLPGVAIATALMPPLCTVGIGVAQQRTDISGGALLLFVVNFVAILFASSLCFALIGFRPAFSSTRKAIVSRTLLLEAGLVLLVAVPLGALMTEVIGSAREDHAIRTTLQAALAELDESTLVSFERRATQDHLAIVATVRSPGVVGRESAARIQRELANRLQQRVALKLLLVPVTSLDPFTPPTWTPTISSSAERAAEPTTVPTTATPVPPSPTATPVPATPTPVPPTAVPSPTVQPPAAPSPTPRAYAVVGATGGRGLNVRVAPGASPRVAVLRDGVIVQLTGRDITLDGVRWQEVVLPDGRVGWVAAPFLVPWERYVAP